MRRDLSNNLKINSGEVKATAGGAESINGLSVDMQGHDSVVAAACFGTIGGSAVSGSLKLQESDDDSAWSDVTEANDLIGSNPAFDQDSDNSCIKLGYVGNKRYVRPVLVVAANDGTSPVSLMMIQDGSHALPQA